MFNMDWIQDFLTDAFTVYSFTCVFVYTFCERTEHFINDKYAVVYLTDGKDSEEFFKTIDDLGLERTYEDVHLWHVSYVC